MFWDGSGWIDEHSLVATRPGSTSRHRRPRWPVVAVMAFGALVAGPTTIGPASAQSANLEDLAVSRDREHEMPQSQESWREVSVWRQWSRGSSSTFVDRSALPSRTTYQTPQPPTAYRPFRAPVTTATYYVPASIDATGATDASAALNRWIRTVPNGSVVAFDADGVYRLDRGILLAGRRNIILAGRGATLRMKGGGNDEAATAFLLRGSSHIAIRSFTVVGNNPNTSTLFVRGKENAHIVGLSGWYGGPPSSYVEISNVTGGHVYGDGAYLEGRNVAPFEPSHHVWIHHNSWSYIGRNAVSSINVTGLLVENNRFAKVGMDAWDIEPNFAGQQVRRNTFRRNTIGSYGHMTQHPGYLVASWNPTGRSRISDITVAGNVVAGNPAGGFDGTPRGLTSKFIAPNTSNVVFKNNITTMRAFGPVLNFQYVNGVTVTGNRQPLISGTLARFRYCTRIVQ